MKIVFNEKLVAVNVFRRELWDDVKKYGIMFRGKFMFLSPKVNEFKLFCKAHGYDVIFPHDSEEIFKKIRRIYVDYDVKSKFHVTFNTDFSPPITRTLTWKKLVFEKWNEKEFTFYYYPFLCVLNLLREDGYDIIYSESLSFLKNPLPIHNEIQKPVIEKNWVPMTHQKKAAETIYQWGGKGIIADEAGLGKTISAVLALMKVFDKLKYKRGIWVVPTVPLLFQVVNELYDRFGVTVYPVTQKSKRFYDDGTTIYDRYPFCAVTWATFRNDWTKNLEKVWKVPFDFGIFDEIHICSNHKNKSYDAVLNFPARFRIGLTGTPLPNGNWRELYNILFIIDPLSVPLLDDYYKREKMIMKKFEKYSKEFVSGSPEKATQRIMNKMTNNELLKKIVRHERSSLSSQLPEIIEIDPIYVPLDSSENYIVDILLEILGMILDEWIHDRKNKIIEYAKSMIWQDLRRFCSYGGKHFDKRIESLLYESSPVYNFIRERYRIELIEMDREVRSHPFEDYPKFPVLLSNFDVIPSHHVLIFCDSILTSIDLAEYLMDHGIKCKVVTGKTNYSKLLDYLPQNEKEKEEKRIKEIFKKLGQKGKMSDDEVNSVIKWFWSPYIDLSEFSNTYNVLYSIDNEEWNRYCYYVNIKKAKKVAIKIIDYHILPSKKRNSIDNVFSEVRIIDEKMKIIDDGKDRTYVFVNRTPKEKKALITTNKLSEGANLQIAQSIVFFDQPLSIREREQRIARVHRMGSPYDRVYIMQVISGIESAVKRALDEKYKNIGKMKISKSKNISIYEIVKIAKEKRSKGQKLLY